MVSLVKDIILYITPATVSPNHWYLTPEHHALEYIVYNFVWISVLLYTLVIKKNNRKSLFPLPKNNITIVEHLLGLTLIACLIIQTTYNIQMNPDVGIVVMLHPCHIIAVLELILIYSKNAKLLHHIFNVVVYYSFYTSLALLLPDTSSLYLPYHKLVFWIEHWFVYLIPFYFVTINRFALDARDSFYLFVSAGFSHLFFWNIELPVSLATSININYALWPSASSPPVLGGKFFHDVSGLVIFIFYTLHGFFMPKLFQKLGGLLNSSAASTASTAPKSPRSKKQK